MIVPFALSLLVLQTPGQDYHRTLKTPHYVVHITDRCTDGSIPCKNVVYEATSSSGKVITLRGKQIYHMCAAAPHTPCHPIGYEFRNGRATYWVGEDGTLRVRRDSVSLVEEQGTWEDE